MGMGQFRVTRKPAVPPMPRLSGPIAGRCVPASRLKCGRPDPGCSAQPGFDCLGPVGLTLPLVAASLLRGFWIVPGPLCQITRPVVHQPAPALEQVRAGVGRLDRVADHMRQGRLDHFPGKVRLQPFGIQVTVPFPVHAGMNRSKKQAHPMTLE